ncbi:MAG: hypothetical protein GY749_24905 [Desulfobacteraceae bacterium]|nr:hypothetical protein [Desulfobacteraceae bacterium]
MEAACDLPGFGTELPERLGQNSRNSSGPPSSDSPFEKGNENNPAPSEPDEKDTLENDESIIHCRAIVCRPYRDFNVLTSS